MLELKKLFFTVQESDNGNDNPRNIIDGIDFTFEKGKFYVITGPNGSGKTTLAKLIMGINPISGGSIFSKVRIYPLFPLQNAPKRESLTVFSNPPVSKELLFGICSPSQPESPTKKNFLKC